MQRRTARPWWITWWSVGACYTSLVVPPLFFFRRNLFRTPKPGERLPYVDQRTRPVVSAAPGRRVKA